MTKCLAAVQKKAAALQYVPEAMRTEQLCLAAVRQTLGCVPEAMRTEQLCLAAVRAADSDRLESIWKQVPEAMRTEQVCLAAVQKCAGP